MLLKIHKGAIYEKEVNCRKSNKIVREKEMKKQYNMRDKSLNIARVARCGHVSIENRYFKCENCKPVLPEDDGELRYFAWDSDENEDENKENV